MASSAVVTDQVAESSAETPAEPSKPPAAEEAPKPEEPPKPDLTSLRGKGFMGNFVDFLENGGRPQPNFLENSQRGRGYRPKSNYQVAQKKPEVGPGGDALVSTSPTKKPLEKDDSSVKMSSEKSLKTGGEEPGSGTVAGAGSAVQGGGGDAAAGGSDAVSSTLTKTPQAADTRGAKDNSLSPVVTQSPPKVRPLEKGSGVGKFKVRLAVFCYLCKFLKSKVKYFYCLFLPLPWSTISALMHLL